ncbi:AGE family epimerase/isomerase [Actinokineospora auranticolor]|uniref:Mannose/cellobiose epimerase-like protein (N-acyl-D-glucosamine 2-epimerase family) n=1 Tax=Actinokineospora auranticolor TaxID=155976 RepID=A0A2S6GMS7_9PSEU|nr:AGE family epimerase/isomerase [Actinokineospora auranticolor]PPK66517.1 mannose/cellobiose epimerase-like protein (N-acyl-D-glucosamine 2-epimerase family) [Actinokineospora auranticolor]
MREFPGSGGFTPDAEWLAAHRASLAAFAARSPDPAGGFRWLDATGGHQPDQPVATWITARMTHVFALEDGLGNPGAAALVDHGVAALRGPLRDAEHGGWFASLADPRKAAYDHAFVLLAACGAHAAGRSGADALLAEACEVVETRFWDGSLPLESWDRGWTETEDYRGANSAMHFVEAFLAAGDVTGDRIWHRRALDIATRIAHEVSAAHDWRVPEHFTADWEPDLDYNRDDPRHPFRPYGGTIGHWLEWARLLLHLEAALGAAAPDWLVADAAALFDSATRRGWAVDGHPGFAYTLDWDDRPVVRERMHWVVAEAVLAASALARRTGKPGYDRWYAGFWDFAVRHHVDAEHGGWWHEVTPGGVRASTVWSGKPDSYHAYQAALFPLLPLAPAAAVAVRA